MRLTGNPGKWLWRRLRLGTWVTRRKAEKLTGTTAKAGPDDAERGADRVTGREKVGAPRHRSKGRGGPRRHHKNRRWHRTKHGKNRAELSHSYVGVTRSGTGIG